MEKHFEIIDIFGWKGALMGMRNPKNSWNRCDSRFDDELIIGANDLKLATILCKAGGEHRKFLRMIHVQMNVYAPRYIWSEFDTYHFNVKNSCSTMHKLLDKNTPITSSMFDYDDKDYEMINLIVDKLESLREDYNSEGSSGARHQEILTRAKQLLPEGFIQMRTVDTTYEELRNIYKQRKYHRLQWWRDFCKELESLPYAKEFIMGESSNEVKVDKSSN